MSAKIFVGPKTIVLEQGDLVTYTAVYDVNHLLVFDSDRDAMFRNLSSFPVDRFLVFDRVRHCNKLVNGTRMNVPVFVDMQTGLFTISNYIVSEGDGFRGLGRFMQIKSVSVVSK